MATEIDGPGERSWWMADYDTLASVQGDLALQVTVTPDKETHRSPSCSRWPPPSWRSCWRLTPRPIGGAASASRPHEVERHRLPHSAQPDGLALTDAQSIPGAPRRTPFRKAAVARKAAAELRPGGRQEPARPLTIVLTSNTYGHVLEQRSQEIARRMDAVLGGDLGGQRQRRNS